MLGDLSPERSNGFARNSLNNIQRGPYRACLADLDGTFVDTVKVEMGVINYVLARYYKDSEGRSNGLDQNRFHHEWSARGNMFELMTEDLSLGVPPRHFKHQVLYFFNKLTRNGVPVIPGAVEFLDRSAAWGLETGLVTSTHRDRMYHKIINTELFPRIAAFTGGDDVPKGRGKPNPDIFRVAMFRLGVSPEECIAVGDSESDMIGAEAAKVKVRILIADDRVVDDKSTTATHIVKSLDNIDDHFFRKLQTGTISLR